MVTGSGDKTAKVWNVADGSVVAEFTGHGCAVSAACFSPCGTMVATGSGDKTAKVWSSGALAAAVKAAAK